MEGLTDLSQDKKELERAKPIIGRLEKKTLVKLAEFYDSEFLKAFEELEEVLKEEEIEKFILGHEDLDETGAIKTLIKKECLKVRINFMQEIFDIARKSKEYLDYVN